MSKVQLHFGNTRLGTITDVIDSTIVDKSQLAKYSTNDRAAGSLSTAYTPVIRPTQTWVGNKFIIQIVNPFPINVGVR